MPGVILNPAQSSDLANDVYALTKLQTPDLAIRYLNNKYRGLLEFSTENLVKGKTGGPGIIKCRTGFGFCLLGKKELEGNAFIIFRGTQYLADWLTNLNVMTSKSCYHQSVHDGFNQAFKSMEPKINDFFSVLPKNNVKTIHCIGHSLGGALATLCGEWIKSNKKTNAYIYTYGSPRVGLKGFSQKCTKEIGAERIFRVYHKTDIVPYIPIWPYVHTPDRGNGYYLHSPGVIPGAEYHDMAKYVKNVRKFSWKSLSAIKPEKKTDAGIAEWLKQKGPVGVTVTVLDWLSDAIVFVIKKCIAGAQSLIEKAMGASATIMDRIAYVLNHGSTLEENISSWVVYLIQKIMSLLGQVRTISQQDLNRQFIKNVFTQLQQKLNSIAQNALNQALVDGRAI